MHIIVILCLMTFNLSLDSDVHDFLDFYATLLTDYLVDDGMECNSTSDLLLERNREQSLVDLLVPSMLLLITLLHKLQVHFMLTSNALLGCHLHSASC